MQTGVGVGIQDGVTGGIVMEVVIVITVRGIVVTSGDVYDAGIVVTGRGVPDNGIVVTSDGVPDDSIVVTGGGGRAAGIVGAGF